MIHEQNSNAIKTAQKVLVKKLLTTESTACIQNISVIQQYHLSSRLILFQVVKDTESDIHQVFSNQMVWTVFHELFYQYATVLMLYHIKYEDGDDSLEMFFGYTDD